MNACKTLKLFTWIQITLILTFILTYFRRNYDLLEFYFFVFIIAVNLVSLIPFFISFGLSKHLDKGSNPQRRELIAKILFGFFVVISVILFGLMIYVGGLDYTKSFG